METVWRQDLLKFYREYQKQFLRTEKNILKNGIAAHCTFHINSLMLCEESKEIKQKIIQLDHNVKRQSLQIYNNMNQMSRTVWLLRKTSYLAYSFIQHHKMKNNQ